MFSYNLRMAFMSMKKHSGLSFLIIAAIGLGIGVCVTLLTVYTLMTKNPIPQFSKQIYTYKLNNQSVRKEGEKDKAAYSYVSYTDAMNVMRAKPSLVHSVHYQTSALYYPPEEDVLPFREDLRLATHGFFDLHRVAFLFGGRWSSDENARNPYQVVLTKKLNDQLFLGRDSVGENLKILDQYYEVVGVTGSFGAIPKYMEVDSGPFDEIAGAYVPLSLIQSLALEKQNGDTRCPQGYDGKSWDSFLQAECYWLHHWVGLDNLGAVSEFRDFLDSYAEGQRQYGRFLGPYKNELHDVMSWLQDRKIVNKDYEFLLAVAFLFLLVCLMNCIGLLLAKFLGKAGETSLRRALGASKKDIFKQHLVEVSIVGFFGGVFGLFIAFFGLILIRNLYENYAQLTYLNLELVSVALILAVFASLISGLLPAWRSCQVSVSKYLNSI